VAQGTDTLQSQVKADRRPLGGRHVGTRVGAIWQLYGGDMLVKRSSKPASVATKTVSR